MSHQRHPSHDVKEPHSVSLKVLRLSRPSLVAQYPIQPPLSSPTSRAPPVPASLAYDSRNVDTNPDAFILSPILNLPPSFGSAYVGETFSCTLCANHDVPPDPPAPSPAHAAGGGRSPGPSPATGRNKSIRDVRLEAEMKTPASGVAARLDLWPPEDDEPGRTATRGSSGVDLEAGQTLQKVVSFDLKEEGNHVLAVTVSYYEATETSGRTRTFRKLYQFVCKASLIVRTKPSLLPPRRRASGGTGGSSGRRWALEAQLENCGEDAVQLERVALDLEPGMACEDCNWEASGSRRPVVQPGEVEQVCFVVEEDAVPKEETAPAQPQEGGRIVFGVLRIGWRGEMGNRGFLSTGKLGTRQVKADELRSGSSR